MKPKFAINEVYDLASETAGVILVLISAEFIYLLLDGVEIPFNLKEKILLPTRNAVTLGLYCYFAIRSFTRLIRADINWFLDKR